MPHLEVIWTDGPDGNVGHLAEHDVSPEEAEEILREPVALDTSRSTGRPIAFGLTSAGRRQNGNVHKDGRGAPADAGTDQGV